LRKPKKISENLYVMEHYTLNGLTELVKRNIYYVDASMIPKWYRQRYIEKLIGSANG